MTAPNRKDLSNCKSFSEVINKAKFEVNIPEYYDTQLHNYFRRPIKKVKPIVNGIEVEWDEYISQNETVTEPMDIVPKMIFQEQPYNATSSFQTIPGIIDLTINNVEYELVHFSDIEHMLNIMQGYRNEVSKYIQYNQGLSAFITKMDQTYTVLNNFYKQINIHKKNMIPHDKRPMPNLLDIIKMMGG